MLHCFSSARTEQRKSLHTRLGNAQSVHEFGTDIRVHRFRISADLVVRVTDAPGAGFSYSRKHFRAHFSSVASRRSARCGRWWSASSANCRSSTRTIGPYDGLVDPRVLIPARERSLRINQLSDVGHASQGLAIVARRRLGDVDAPKRKERLVVANRVLALRLNLRSDTIGIAMSPTCLTNTLMLT